MKGRLLIVYVLAGLLFSLPCRAQQPNGDKLRATAASLTAESAKRGENANFQACGTDTKYALCITFPGVDASDFAEKTYTNLNFAKQMAGQGFAAVLLRNTTADKTLSQNYTMNVTEQGWAAYDKHFPDVAEEIAAMLAANQHDPAKKVIALRTFIQRYPNSVAKESILDLLAIAQTETGDKEGGIATAKQLLAIVDASDPVRVNALWELVYLSVADAKAGTNTDQNQKQAKEYSEIGMQALEQVKKPEYMSEEQFATLKSNATAMFEGVIRAQLMNSLVRQTIEVVSSQPGPSNTWMVNTRSTTANITMVLFCSTDVPDYYCGRLEGKLDATLLPADDQSAYKYYPTYQMANRTLAGYAIYKVRDSQGYSHEGRYPDKSGAKPQFAENGGAGRSLDMDHLQSQDKTDEQAVCLQFIQKATLANFLPVPTVDCYDRITYTHVNLTNPPEGGTSVRGIIVHDNRVSSCGSSGCAVYLAIQGCPGNEERCRNWWIRGMDAFGSDIKITNVNHGGWYDVLLTRTPSHAGSSIQQSTYRYVGNSYQDVAVTAREEKKARDEAMERRSLALSLGLHSGQSQATVRAILAARGYHRLQDEPGQNGPWNCTSGGWKDGQWTTSCISQKGDVTLRLLFELGEMHRNADTGALQQERTDRLLFASFQFAKYEFPDNTLHLVSPTLKKCHGGDNEDGVCLNF
jgi:hypothetical protein